MNLSCTRTYSALNVPNTVYFAYYDMRVLTFGWDFPPIRNGGLGVACQGLTQELIELGVEVIFVLPRQQEVVGPLRFIFADVEPAELHVIDSPLLPYQSSRSYIELFEPGGKRIRLSRNKIEEVYRYALAARKIAMRENFDVIHAHDWSSYLAGLAAKSVSGKPLVLHVHATAFDQAASDHVDPDVYEIERQAFHGADSVVAISNYTRDIVVNKYGTDPEKVTVVHNGIKPKEHENLEPVLEHLKAQGKKIVFYNGRITIQKGVDYFIRAARRVVDVDPNVVFVISGWGDMEQQIMHLVGSLGLSQNVIFAGALWEEERDRMYQSADLLVMPSVSEPFGLVPLEAIQQGTPALISKQSGVSEVLSHVLKVDFWDVEEMANKIVAALRYPTLNQQLVNEGRLEVLRLTWRRAADKILDLYQKLIDLVTPNR